jgi:hypothetical protein
MIESVSNQRLKTDRTGPDQKYGLQKGKRALFLLRTFAYNTNSTVIFVLFHIWFEKMVHSGKSSSG